MNLKSENITRAFRIIEVQTGFSVVYAQSQIKNAVPVTIDVTKQNLFLVLQKIFKDQPFTFTVSNRIIAVKSEEEVPQRKREERLVVRGKVTNADGHPLSAVSVVIPGTPFGAMTNQAGEYMLNEVPENANLVFTYVGYEKLQLSVNGRTTIDATLTLEVKGPE